MPPAVSKAVILARGLGTRVQKRVGDVSLDDGTEALADRGWKAVILIGGKRPFLDYSIDILRRVGLKEVCLVVGPEHTAIRRYYQAVDHSLPDLSIRFATQLEPLGTADAVLAAREFVGSDPFLVLNGDDLYPEATIRTLLKPRENTCYVVGFEREALVAESNFTAERVKRFAVLEVDDNWRLKRIVEKPDNPDQYRTPHGVLVNMNLFRFTPDIFWACERVEPHPVRGEYELPAAVQLLVDEGVEVRVLLARAGVLDLTYRADIPQLQDRLKGVQLGF
jgi:glucose-1-phosphate thymidylyltransferase